MRCGILPTLVYTEETTKRLDLIYLFKLVITCTTNSGTAFIKLPVVAFQSARLLSELALFQLL